MTEDAERIVGLYERHAHAWADRRSRAFIEKAWLDRFAALLPAGAEVLDIGCGTGEPIARYLSSRGFAVTGIDSSPTFVRLARGGVGTEHSSADFRVGDMRLLQLKRRFAGLLAWDSFFHLTGDDQAAMFAVFAAHAANGAALMFTSGPKHGEAIGSFAGEPLYHASLDPDAYRALLDRHGFDVVAHVAEDRECGGHTVWLARRRKDAADH
jgi:cyclopropane fatty-acyl-phospholipid synthase-like methyltransferase